MAYDQSAYNVEYTRQHYRAYNFRVSKELDKDIVDAINEMMDLGIPKNVFIKECIRATLKDKDKVDSIIAKAEAIKRARI